MKKTTGIAAGIIAAAMTGSFSGISAFADENSEMSIRQMIDSMTTEQKIEQMMMITMRPWSDGEGTVNVTSLNEEQRIFIQAHNFGGVCLYSANISGIVQCAALTDEIQQAALNSECGIPMLIAADQEGGNIYRLATGTPTSGNMALGATGNPEYAYENASIIGSELKAVGINTNFAPVLDVNNNPTNPVINVRSFSSDPKIVSEMGVQYIKGLQNEGVISTVKHFPGHGDTGTDSHTGMPLINKSYNELKNLELYPYTAAVEAGTDMVMTAHIQFPQIETGTYTSKSTGEEIGIPATLSKTIITDILRNDYQFDGVVCTDSMVMDAIQVNFDRVDAATLAINADVDIILEPMTISSTGQIAEMEQYISDIAQQVEDGVIPVDTIDRSVERILTLKQERGILDYAAPDTETALQIVGSAENREKALEIAERAVTLVKNDDNTLPLKLGEHGKVAYFYAYANVEKTMTFALDRLKKDGVIAEGVTAECNCLRGHKAAEYEKLIQNSDAVILALEMYSTATLDPTNEARGWQSAFADDMIALAHSCGKKVVFVSANIPYDVARYTDADAILAVYCANGMDELPVDGQENPAYGVNYPAAFITVFGGNAPTGMLPVDIYAIVNNNQYTDEILYPCGFGLTFSNIFTDLIAKTLCSSAEKEYQQRTGDSAANSDCTFYADGSAVITLTDENGNVLDVYKVDMQTGQAVIRSGDTVDLTAYIPTIPEDEYFAAPEYIGEIARKYYKDQTGESATGTMMQTDAEAGTITVTLSNDAGETLVVYTIDARTGIGTDNSGNAVDLSVYKDYHPVTEEDYFIAENLMDDAARGYYTEQTGTETAGTMTWFDNSEPSAVITIFDADDNVLDEYTIDPTTGIGKDSKGNAVDLAAYADTHEIEDSNPFFETDESEYFAPSGQIMEYAQEEYKNRTGEETAGVSFSVDAETLIAVIELYSRDDTLLDVYTIDVRTGTGTDQNGETVDLSVYVNQQEDDISEYLRTVFCGLVQKDYQQRTGTEAANASMELSEDSKDAVITLTSEDGTILDTYTINTETGTGTNQKGEAVDLTALFPKEEDYFVPSDQLTFIAKKYYYEQTGEEPMGVSCMLDPLTAMMTIEINDVDFNTVETYTVDPITGIGQDSQGNAVDFTVYADFQPLDESGFFASPAELCDMAKKDYGQKTGKTCESVMLTQNDYDHTVTITLMDADENELDVYTINPYTGEGLNTAGAAVNLPQTGITSPKTAAAAAGGLLMLVSGLFMVLKSGMLRKKEESTVERS